VSLPVGRRDLDRAARLPRGLLELRHVGRVGEAHVVDHREADARVRVFGIERDRPREEVGGPVEVPLLHLQPLLTPPRVALVGRQRGPRGGLGRRGGSLGAHRVPREAGEPVLQGEETLHGAVHLLVHEDAPRRGLGDPDQDAQRGPDPLERSLDHPPAAEAQARAQRVPRALRARGRDRGSRHGTQSRRAGQIRDERLRARAADPGVRGVAGEVLEVEDRDGVREPRDRLPLARRQEVDEELPRRGVATLAVLGEGRARLPRRRTAAPRAAAADPSPRVAAIRAASVSPPKAGRPASISYRTAPTAKRSARPSASWPWSCSGAM
jgi:hypothetical protein